MCKEPVLKLQEHRPVVAEQTIQEVRRGGLWEECFEEQYDSGILMKGWERPTNHATTQYHFLMPRSSFKQHLYIRSESDNGVNDAA